MERAHSEGFVVLIELSLSRWLQKIGGKRPRGFVLLKGRNLEEEYRFRYPLYRRYAHFVVDGNLPFEEMAEVIVGEYLRRFG